MIKSCPTCWTAKQTQWSRKEYPTYLIEAPLQVYDDITIDYSGPFPTTDIGSQYVLHIVERLTGNVTLVVTQRADARTTSIALYYEVFLKHGLPRVVRSDQGVHFTEQVIELLMEILALWHKLSAAYRPQTSGKASVETA